MNTGAPEDYLRHEGALRSLARTLVANESSAEDVVQDTWLAALRRPPRRQGIGGHSPGRWLAAAARNVARQIGRADDRRKRRELIAALPERLPAVEEVAERAALHRELVDRVLALDEPYRSALLLRYFEDLPPRAIAQQLGVDVATVNQRLWRGRQRLREALDGRYGGRNAWRGFFVLALGGPEAFLPPAPPLAWLHALPLQLAAAGFAGALILGARVLLLPPGEGRERGSDATSLASDGVANARPGEGRDSLDGDVPRAPAVPPVPPVAPAVRQHEVEHNGATPTPAPRSAPSTAATPEREIAPGPEVDPLAALGYAPPGEVSGTPRRGRPPGTLRVRGGRIRVGARDLETVERMQGNSPMAGVLAGETPEHAIKVEPFDLMTTEVTNEQYEAFVRATGARPPYTWSASAIEHERRAWFERDQEKRQQARKGGLRSASTEKFEPERWWNANWQGQPFAVPPEIAEQPVVYVSYAEAQAYARWAGMRLPTEFELQAAVGAADYPWGKRWVEDATLVLAERPEPVGSRPRGASSAGAFDLAGSVWEWTASPYVAYEGYKALTATIDGAIETPLAPFDANHRVTFGGSYVNDALAQRRSVRMPSSRDQRTSALGFRCVASAMRGADLVRELAEEFQPEHERKADETDALDPDPVLLLERWTAEPGAVGRRLRDYAVITDYDYVAFVPGRASAETQGLFCGVLLTSVPIAEPELAPGRYVLKRLEDEAVVYDVGPGEGGGAGPAGEVARVPLSAQRVPSAAPGAIGLEPGWPLMRLSIGVFVPSDGGRDGEYVQLRFGFAPGTVDASWTR